MKRNIITEYIDRQQEELVEFAASLIRPVNPYFVNERDSEKKVQEVFKQKLLDLGLK